MPLRPRPPRLVPAVGLSGCVALAFALPVTAVVSGAAVLVLGVGAYGLRKSVATGSAR
ncbi:hypothetical protein ACFXKR_12785 [Streptomyces violascens]|uniref:hypothetical protein n=1 Tax=Streptomyces violascens TaxID=67381 RepID=UPI0036B1AD34